MKSKLFAVTALAALLLAGCVQDVYQIEITPEDGAFRRVVTCWRERGHDPPELAPLPEEQLQRIEAAYDRRHTVDEGPKRRFEGRFENAMPDDVGGDGSYTRWTTSLGSLSYYVERFRGDDDLEADLAPRRKAADTLADLAVGWAESELAEQPGFGGLRDFLDHTLRRDLTNLGVYAWQAEAAKVYEEQVGEEFVVRFVQYLVERDYLGPRDVPAIYAAVGDDFRPLAGLVKRVLVRELEADEPVPKSLRWLSDPQRLKASFEEYVRTTDVYEEHQAEWRREHAEDPEQEPPEPADAIAQLRDHLLAHREAPAAAAVVEVTLATEVEPLATNGQWDAEAGRVHWARRLARHRALPSVCFAAWSVPEGEAQKERFGKITLDGAELAQYVLWYEALPDDKGRQWDAFLDDLSPDDDLQRRLRRFRFDGEPEYRPDLPEDQQPESRADEPRRLILQGLGNNPSVR